VGIVFVSDCLCLFVRALNAKRLELSAQKSVEIQSMQRWTWVEFSGPNPPKSVFLITQANPTFSKRRLDRTKPKQTEQIAYRPASSNSPMSVIPR